PRRALDERRAAAAPPTALSRRATPENPSPSTSSGPARGYGARPRHHPRRAAPACPRRAPSGGTATDGPLPTCHAGKPVILDVERPGARLRRSAAPPPSTSSPGVPSTSAERLQRHQRPSLDEPHRKTRHPRRRAARRAATALGRATTLDEQPRRALDERRAAAAPPTALSRRATPQHPAPSTSSGPARGYGARPRHHPRRAAPACPRRAPSGCSATNGPLSTSHTGKPVTLDVERPGARLRRSAAPPPSTSSPGVPSTSAERLQRHQRPSLDEPHRKTRHPRRRAARRAATALGRATPLDEQPRRARRARRPAAAPPTALSRRATPENPSPSTSSGPARGYGARPRHHPRRAAPACPRRAPSGCS